MVTPEVNDCPGCGTGTGPLVASPACRERFDVVLAREFGDPEYFFVHRLTVGAYQLQHPDGVTDHSLAVLTSALDDVDLDLPAQRRRMRWVAETLRTDPRPRPATPAHRGEMTIVDVVAARTAEEHCALVRRWAEQVRAAWAPTP